MSLEPSDSGRPAGNMEIGALLRAGFAPITDRPPHHIFAVVGIWALILIAIQFVVVLGSGDPEPVVTEPDPGGAEPAASGAGLFAGLLLQAVGIAASIDIAVKWIRYLILDEVPQGFADPRLNARRWSYFLRSLLLIAVLAVPIGLALIVTSSLSAGEQGLVVVVIVLAATFAATYLYVGRFGLYLAGAALGDPRMTLTASWGATRECGLTVTLAVLAAILLLLGPYLILLMLLPTVLLVPIEIGLNIALFLISDAIIAHVYTRLVPEPQPGTLVL